MSWSRGLFGQLEVVYALALRETRTRFGAHQMGYLWALLEPTIMIATFVAVFGVAHRKAPPGMDLVGFIATGIITYTLFANATNRVAEAINGNKALLFYPHVQPIDLVLARGLLEFATYTAVFVLFLGGQALFRETLDIHDGLLVLQGLALAALLGSALGLIFCGLSQFSNVADRARGPLLRPLFWCSGIFFSASQLPDRARDLSLYNPVLHIIEMVRAGWYATYPDEYVDTSYVLAWVLGLSLAGLILERLVRRRIEVT